MLGPAHRRLLVKEPKKMRRATPSAPSSSSGVNIRLEVVKTAHGGDSTSFKLEL